MPAPSLKGVMGMNADNVPPQYPIPFPAIVRQALEDYPEARNLDVEVPGYGTVTLYGGRRWEFRPTTGPVKSGDWSGDAL